MIHFLLQLAQDPELERALREDRVRIESRAPLTAGERAAYHRAEALPPPPKRTLELRVQPLSFSDTPLERKDVPLEALAAYYRAQSGGALEIRIESRPPAALECPRADFAKWAPGSKEEQDALAPWLDRGPVLIVLAGELGARGTSLWPHKSTRARVDYLLVAEKGDHRWDGIVAHEFGHLLGLEDKYEDKEAKVGRWCLMGTGYLGSTKEDPAPSALCAACREALGWTMPATVEPEAPAAWKLDGPLRITLTQGKEALLLEPRGKSLVVWHLGGGKPLVLAAELTARLDRLTPLSDPPFRPRTAGAKDVWITDARFEDGSWWLKIAPEGSPTPLEELRRARVGRFLDR